MKCVILSDNNFSPLDIYTIGFSDDVRVTHFGPGQRQQYIVHYVISGKGFYNGNSVLAGQGFLIYPGMQEEYYSDSKEPWSFLWVISEDEKMREIFSRYNADSKTLIFDYNAVSDVNSLVKELMMNNNKVLDSLKVLEMFLKLINSHLTKDKFKELKSNSETYLSFCVEYIEKNIYKAIKVEELTGLLGVSQPYLYKIFSKKFEMSPKQYIIERKIHYAKKLLKETDMSVAKVSNSVGYDDVFAFSRIFSQKEKMSPQKFRITIT